VIAVGATTNRDQRASFSNFGTGLDIVAPGVNIHTTDRLGAAGASGTDYHTSFTGTSAACPNAAGVAALILSVNPALTQAQARQILESTTDKPSSFSFSTVAGQPNGTWNNEVGYGRLNAYNAVRLAAGGSITGSDVICSWNSPAFSLATTPPGLNITWQAEPSYLVSQSSGTGATANFTAADSWSNGRVTLTFSSQGACSSVLLSKTVSIGPPVITPIGYSYSGGGPYPLLPYYTVTNNPVYDLYTSVLADISFVADAPSVNVYAIQQSDGSITWGQQTGPQNGFFYFDFMEYNQWVVLRVEASNSCGTEYFDAGFYGPEQWGAFAMSPNPASDELNIALTPQTDNRPMAVAHTDAPVTARELQVTLMDKNGSAIRSATGTGENDIRFDTRDLADGMYYLHIIDGLKVIRKHVIIKH
jgi:hypothetical protein